MRPKGSLIRSAVISFFAASIPVFGVLYWYATPFGIFPQLLAVHLTIAAAMFLMWWRQSTVFSATTPDVLTGRGIFSPLISVPISSIRRVELVEVYRPNSPETTTQLVALDREGNCLWRMRGQYWHPGDLAAYAKAIGRPVTVVSTPLSAHEFFEDYPGSEYWFENSVPIRVSVIIGIALVVLLLGSWLMRLVGIPLVGA